MYKIKKNVAKNIYFDKIVRNTAKI